MNNRNENRQRDIVDAVAYAEASEKFWKKFKSLIATIVITGILFAVLYSMDNDLSSSLSFGMISGVLSGALLYIPLRIRDAMHWNWFGTIVAIVVVFGAAFCILMPMIGEAAVSVIFYIYPIVDLVMGYMKMRKLRGGSVAEE